MTRGRPHRCLQCDEVIRRCQQGITATEIAASFQRPPGWVYNILKRHHVLPAPPPAPALRRPDVMPFFRDGKTPSWIARHFGISRERVRQILVSAGIAHPDRRCGRHTCTDACAAVLAASPSFVILVLAKETGITTNRLRWAMRVHHVKNPREPRRHQCDSRCEIFRRALAAGESAAEAARQVGWPENTGPGRLRVFHPDWPWPSDSPRMRTARRLLERFITVCPHEAVVADAQKFLDRCLPS